MQKHVEMTHAAFLRGDFFQKINATFGAKEEGGYHPLLQPPKKLRSINYIPISKKNNNLAWKMHLQPDFLVDSTKTGTMADLFCLSHGDDALGPEIGGE